MFRWKELVETDSFFMPVDSTEEEIFAEASYRFVSYMSERYGIEQYFHCDDIQVEIVEQEILIHVYERDC